VNIENISNNDLFDIVIIGAGPVGLYAAYYAGLRKMKVKVIESLPEVGGQLTALYPEKSLYDVPGFPKVGATKLTNELYQQAMQYNPTFVLGARVVNIEVLDELSMVILVTDDGAHHYARSIVIAAGSGAFTPRKPKLDRIDEFDGHGVHYSVRNKSQFTGKKVLIAGGGDSAFDWAFELSEIAESVTLIHRSDKFRAHEDSVQKVLGDGIVDILTFHELKALSGEGHLSKVTIVDNRTKEETELDVDDLIVTMGFLSSIGPIAEWGFELNKNSIIVDQHMQTTIPRVYAAGDIVTYPGKLKLIVSGFSDAATAVNNAKAATDPSAKVYPGHSSDHG